MKLSDSLELKDIFKMYANYGKDVGCGDKGSTHSYIETYSELLKPFRSGCSIMEIGIALGHSIQMWDKYFSNSNIIGVDISLVCQVEETGDNNIKLIEADATKPDFLDKIKDQKFDIVIDDGEHTQQSQIATFNLLKSKMNPGGIYIIEDILNPEMALPDLTKIHTNCEIVDLRGVKGRFDDMLLIYRF